MRWILLAFLIIPALEIGVFVWAGGLIGPWWVMAIILLTGVIGVTAAKHQGMETWNRARMSMNQGQVPAEEILNGLCIFIGAVFLFTPGFVTDLLGFLLIIPFSRDVFKILIEKLIRRKMNKSTIIYPK